MTLCAVGSLMFLNSTSALLHCGLYCWGLTSTNHISQLPLPAGCLLESATGNLKLLLENQKGQAERFLLWAPTVWQALVCKNRKSRENFNSWSLDQSTIFFPGSNPGQDSTFWPTTSWSRTTWDSFSNSTAVGAAMGCNSGTSEASYP